LHTFLALIDILHRTGGRWVGDGLDGSSRCGCSCSIKVVGGAAAKLDRVPVRRLLAMRRDGSSALLLSGSDAVLVALRGRGSRRRRGLLVDRALGVVER
jgi:hypothetical protein